MKIQFYPFLFLVEKIKIYIYNDRISLLIMKNKIIVMISKTNDLIKK